MSSLRRIEYVRVIRRRHISEDRCNPHNGAFDPLKAAALLGRRGERDEAVWMAFIATQFGRHQDDGWRLAANIMGSFGEGPVWTAANYGRARENFDAMLRKNEQALSDKLRSGRYSNHRQYQSKKPHSISLTFSSFYEWQFSHGGFWELLRLIHEQRGQEPTNAFDGLYKSMDAVSGFGRLGRFDFLTMLGKLDLAPIEPGSVYLVGATGPLAGAKLLFYGDRAHPVSAAVLEPRVDRLDEQLQVGKQAIEDSLCNWQKRPDRYEYFRG